MIGVGRHLVDGVRDWPGPSRRRERVDVQEAARKARADRRPAGVAATAPERSGFTAVA
ncbi:hypothetical protein [Streptomyces sp. NPDC058656]|uniref:hypothetical protein n=1 Tax=unclassified Streptomyces TaxID=2593676 RepID=UPI00365842B2